MTGSEEGADMDLTLKEVEGNYDSLSEVENNLHGAAAMEDEREEDSSAFLDQPARTPEEADRQLEILYQRQRAIDRRSVDPTCQCEYCVELRSRIDSVPLATFRGFQGLGFGFRA
jgi:hypothetical protein